VHASIGKGFMMARVQRTALHSCNCQAGANPRRPKDGKAFARWIAIKA